MAKQFIASIKTFGSIWVINNVSIEKLLTYLIILYFILAKAANKNFYLKSLISIKFIKATCNTSRLEFVFEVRI